MSVVTVKLDPAYCGTCYGAAERAGRAVRQTEVYEFPVCAVCETRLRNGLVHYRPSNGAEAEMFRERCERCRHYTESAEGYGRCALKILDRIEESAWDDYDSSLAWYDPADLRTKLDDGAPCCPAECLRFEHKGNGEGRLYAPPPRDCEGQMFFGDLDVPVERVPATPALAEANR